MEDVSDGGTQWRDGITEQLIELFGSRIEILDPTKNEGKKIGIQEGDQSLTVNEAKEKMYGWKISGHYEFFDPAARAIIDEDIACVRRSNFLIVFLKFKDNDGKKVQMGGTIGEIQHAYDHNIPMYAVCYNNVGDMNTWVLGLVRTKGKLFPNFSQCLDMIKEDFKDNLLTEEEQKALKEKVELEQKIKTEEEELSKNKERLTQINEQFEEGDK